MCPSKCVKGPRHKILRLRDKHGVDGFGGEDLGGDGIFVVRILVFRMLGDDEEVVVVGEIDTGMPGFGSFIENVFEGG
jgi:hypothetical protein